MAQSLDLIAWNFGSVLSPTQLPVNTIVTSSTIKPLTKLTLLTGSNNINNITAPFNGYHELILVAIDGSFSFLGTDTIGTGNIFTSISILSGNVTIAFYHPVLKGYYLK